VRILLDTHIVLWWHTADRRLERGARRLIESADDQVLVSRASLWEVAIKVSAGKLPADAEVFAKQVEEFGFSWLDITNTHLLKVAELPTVQNHKDPFDRLLVAQAMSEPLILLAADIRLARYGDLVRAV
jgi:PIN domain nuclease of toxin-antitoxin system